MRPGIIRTILTFLCFQVEFRRKNVQKSKNVPAHQTHLSTQVLLLQPDPILPLLTTCFLWLTSFSCLIDVYDCICTKFVEPTPSCSPFHKSIFQATCKGYLPMVSRRSWPCHKRHPRCNPYVQLQALQSACLSTPGRCKVTTGKRAFYCVYIYMYLNKFIYIYYIYI